MPRLIFAALLVALSASGAWAQGPIAIASGSVRTDTFRTSPSRYPGGIVADPHVEFANYVGYRPLTFDLYRHRDRKPRPLIVWLHGGGWNRGDARQSGAFADWPAVLAKVAARGYVVASVDYRLSGEARFPAQIADVKAAIRFLRAGAVAYGIDSSRVYVWGGSAGGHLAALAATGCGMREWQPAASTGRLSKREAAAAQVVPQSDCVQGAAIWYGVMDLVDYASASGSSNVAALLGCSEPCDDEARLASPIAHVDARTPPMLLVHGTADEEVAFRQSERLAERLRAAGRPVEIELIAGIGHGFIGRDGAATRHASLKALARTLAWFDKLAGVRRN